jgi:hypothetical protein
MPQVFKSILTPMHMVAINIYIHLNGLNLFKKHHMEHFTNFHKLLKFNKIRANKGANSI